MSGFFGSLFGSNANQQQQQQQQQQSQYEMPPQFQFNAVQQQQEQLPPNPPRVGSGGLIKRVPQPDDNDPVKGKKVVAVVVTINSGSSYDPLFTTHPQVSPDGVVRVYSCSFNALPVLRRYLTSDTAERDSIKIDTTDTDTLSVIDELLEHLITIDPEAVVFNFECCGGCSDHGFPTTPEVMKITKHILEKKFTVMFSDFSLKALIGTWDAAVLGPNPFVKVGELSSRMELRFNVDKLKSEDDCPSAQLTKVAELCKDGIAQVKAMGGTIMYSLADEKPPGSAPYTLDVLTVLTAADGNSTAMNGKKITVDGNTGICGHVALKYPSGGVLLTSCGHWVSLCHLDTTEENLRDAVTKQMGAENYAAWSYEYDAAPAPMKSAMLQRKAAECVQTSAPCKYSKSAF
eukprot:TRINITY_DN3839_c0_g1_i1.p1 TRINITY_DN3839_c0_g1~~TRINITY_DN3839_c0_g1_i1.p1  ORF type:complete len:403 (+),score=103.65 TRINITY_DN3839_c0_g1_i1:86-1294(+)